MITVTNRKLLHGISFEDYLKMGGYSNSFLKSEVGGVSPEFIGSDAVRFGSMVDEILTEPGKVDVLDPIYPEAKEVAFTVMQFFGLELWESFTSQLSFTCDLNYQGLIMPVRGRLDKYNEKGKMVIDLKITNSKVKNIPTLVEFMGYNNQLWLYAKGVGAEKAILLFYSRPDKKTYIHIVDVSSDSNKFFEDKILMFGK